MKYDDNLFPFKSKNIEIKNHNIHYIDEGQGPTILFSHAALGSSFMYRRFIEMLSTDHRCVALDFPGFGLSTNKSSEAYSVSSQARIMDSFIKILGLRKIFAFGHDTGGPSIFSVASKRPEWFEGLILTDTIIFPTHEYPRVHAILKIIGNRLFQYLNAKTNLLVKFTFTKGIPTRRLNQKEKEEYFQLFSSYSQRSRITEILYSLRENDAFMSEIVKGFKNQLHHKPTLLIYGQNDPVTKLGIPDRIHKMMSNAELHLIPGEGHFPHEGQPDKMCNLIRAWTKSLV